MIESTFAVIFLTLLFLLHRVKLLGEGMVASFQCHKAILKTFQEMKELLDGLAGQEEEK